MPKLKMNLLGRVSVTWSDGTSLRFSTRHAILALVALSREPVRRDDLALILWPYVAPVSRAQRLRSLLPHLRRALGDSLSEVDQTLSIVPGTIEVDAWSCKSYADYHGDFMPGFEQDWVIDLRLDLRMMACESALNTAANAKRMGDDTEALRLVARAMEIDPLNEEAAQLRVDWLSESGRKSLSIHIADEHRRRVLHDLGSLPAVQPTQEMGSEHPLIRAANWLLDSNPYDLAPMLIATQNEWANLPVAASLQIFDRALQWMKDDGSHGRRILEAQRICLMVQAGQLHQNLDAARGALEAAEAAGDHCLTSQLSMALSYGFLSSGEFARSLEYANRSASAAKVSGNVVNDWSCRYNLAIIQSHCGLAEAGQSATIEFIERQDEVPSELLRAGLLISSIEALLNLKKIDQADRQLELGRRLYSELGPHRHEAWILISQARIHDTVGEHRVAIGLLESATKIGRDVAGHSAMSMAADQLARTWCRLGEYQTGYQCYRDSIVLRRTMKTVPSVWETKIIRETGRMLQQGLGNISV